MSFELSNISDRAYEYANHAAVTFLKSRNSTIKFLKINLPADVVKKVSQIGLIIKDSEANRLINNQGTSPSAIGVGLLGLISGAGIRETPFTTILTLGSASLLAGTKTQFALLVGSVLTGVVATSLFGRANPIPLG